MSDTAPRPPPHPRQRFFEQAGAVQNQAFSALPFLYEKVLKVDLGLIAGVVRAKRPKRLPVILPREEIKAIIARVAVSAAEAGGLRPHRVQPKSGTFRD